MANSEQILSDVLDWCIQKTNISETKGIDHQGHRVDFIHYAAERGYYQVVRKLFKSGISINCPAPNFLRKTPLHYASENNHLNFCSTMEQRSTVKIITRKLHSTMLQEMAA